MLIHEKIFQTHLTESESSVARYIRTHENALEYESIRSIAHGAFASTSVCISLAHKLGFSTWSAFKNAFIAETRYLNSNFRDIDANTPFGEDDDIMSIANRIATLSRETIDDTMMLVSRPAIETAISCMAHARRIALFCASNLMGLCEEFIFDMGRIDCLVDAIYDDGEQMFRALNCTSQDCAIIVSYSGETDIVRTITCALSERDTPIIALTNLGESTLSQYASITLPLTTRERQFSKIASFSVNTSIRLWLNILYSCMFARNYQQNLRYRIDNARQVETPAIRYSDSPILREPHAARHLSQKA